MGEIGPCQFPPSCAHKLPVILRRAGGRDAHDRVIAICSDDRSLSPAQAVWSSSALDPADAMAKPLPEHDDPAVRRAKVLQAVDGDRSLTDLGLVIAGLPLTRLIGIGGKLARGHDVAIRPPFRRDARRFAYMPEFDQQGIDIIHGHNPAAQHRTAEGMLLAAIFPDRSNLL